MRTLPPALWAGADSCRNRAAYWYRKALPKLKGLSRTTVEKRLDELEKRVQPVLASIDANAGRDYKNQVNRLRDAVKVRPKNIEEQLSKMMKK